MAAPLFPLTFNPFENIAVPISKKTAALPITAGDSTAPKAGRGDTFLDIEAERRQFLDAMRREGVKPLDEGRRDVGVAIGRSPAAALCPPDNGASEAFLRLRNLVELGEGFNVSDTPEYMEGTGCSVPSSYAWRLHHGDFSIQAFIDLHGMNAQEAKTAIDAFLKEALAKGKRAVLIIHGRGLSSRAEPVLKNSVRARLTSRAWKKWLIAFSSAQSFDGGAGATYVLLRERPFSGKSAKRRGN